MLKFEKRVPNAVLKESPEYSKYKNVYKENGTDENYAACTQLNSDKEQICHATAFEEFGNPTSEQIKKGKPTDMCKSGDDQPTLQVKTDLYTRCYNLRAIQNTANCFKEPDAGHIDAQAVESENVQECNALLTMARASKPAPVAFKAAARPAVGISQLSKPKRKQSSSRSRSRSVKARWGNQNRPLRISKSSKFQGTRSSKRKHTRRASPSKRKNRSARRSRRI